MEGFSVNVVNDKVMINFYNAGSMYSTKGYTYLELYSMTKNMVKALNVLRSQMDSKDINSVTKSIEELLKDETNNTDNANDGNNSIA